jgi:UDPglucose 6-dehydrogenase
LLALYAPLATTTPILVTGRKTAELIKYAANAFLATKITFINEMADLCERAEADVRELAMGVGLDHRIGTSFLNAGPGYGGSCFPKDTLALLRTAQDLGVSLRIVEETVTSNDARKRKMALKVSEAVGGCVDGLTIAVLGLSFKPDTDDMRDAPSIPLVEALQRMGASVRAHDPVGMERAKEVFEDVAFFDDAYTCASGVDAVVLVTDWNEFRHLDLRKLRNVMLGDVLVDLRNIIDVDHARRHGLKVTNLGVRNGEPTTPVPAGVARTIPAEVKKEIRHDQT